MEEMGCHARFGGSHARPTSVPTVATPRAANSLHYFAMQTGVPCHDPKPPHPSLTCRPLRCPHCSSRLSCPCRHHSSVYLIRLLLHHRQSFNFPSARTTFITDSSVDSLQGV